MENSSRDDDDSRGYANQHIPKALAIPDTPPEKCPSVQVIHDGRQLTTAKFLRGEISLNRPILVRDVPESIGMKVPVSRNKKRTPFFSVRDVANVVGHFVPVNVIDVEHQEELEGWQFGDLVEYFEDETRLQMMNHRDQQLEKQQQQQQQQHSSATGRVRRKAAIKSVQRMQDSRPRVLNQISYEFSRTKLADLVRSPQFVRDLDWIDHAWSPELRKRGEYPVVQYYCLTSAGGCYTDFHLDFGGSSVWYHVLGGSKVFVMLPPTKKNLGVYEEWLCKKNQAVTFLPDMLEDQSEVFRITLRQNETMVIPSGWIHAVYTPEDSLVFGGNFLHGLDMELQLQVNSIEVRTRVQEKFRFPHFIPLQFYAGSMYLNKLRKGKISKREAESLPVLMDALEAWWNVHQSQQEVVSSGPTVAGAALHAKQQNRCDSVEDFLSCLRKEHARVMKEGARPNPAYSSSASDAKAAPTSNGTPRIRLKISSQPKGEEQANDKLRIALSSSASDSDPLPADILSERVKPREDTGWYEGEDIESKDDDWRPKKKARSVAPRAKEAAAPLSRPRGFQGPSQPLRRSSSSSRSSKTKTSSVRSRLLNKLGG